MIIREYKEKDFNDLTHLYKDFFNEMREWQDWEQLKLDEKEAEETAKGSQDKNSWVLWRRILEGLLGLEDSVLGRSILC